MADNPNRIARPDLVGSVRSQFPNLTEGYIGDQIFPVLPVFQTSGSHPFMLYNAAGTAQTGRSASGSVTADNNRGANLENYTCAEVLSRQTIDEDQTVMLGGRAAQELALGVSGFREVSDKTESKQAIAIDCGAANAGSPTDGTSALYDTVLAAVDSLRPYGKVALVGAKSVFNLLRKDSNVRDMMKSIGTPVMELKDIKSIGSDILAAIFGADYCFEAIGPASAVWSATRIGVIVKPDMALNPMSFPQLGRTVTYAWATGQETETMAAFQSYDVSKTNDILDFKVKNVVVKPTHSVAFYKAIKLASES